MDPVLGLIGGIAAGTYLSRKAIDYVDKIEFSGGTVHFKVKKVDYHALRRMETETEGKPWSVCDDPACPECYGLSIEVHWEPAEVIVDGYLVPVPRGVPKDAYAWTSDDDLTDAIFVYWQWTGGDGKEKKARSVTTKREVKSIG